MTIRKLYSILNPKMGQYGKYLLPLSYANYNVKDVVINTRKQDYTTVFDVSHMGLFETPINQNTTNYLSNILNNNLNTLNNNKSRLAVLLNDKGNIIDDLIIGNINNDKFRLVVNANNKCYFDNLENLKRNTNNIIAVQGPGSQKTLEKLFNIKLNDLYFMENRTINKDISVCRCGYTGEDGFELYLNYENNTGNDVFFKLIKQSRTNNKILFGGLIARDILRLEAGLNLSGSEFDKDMNINFGSINMNFLVHSNYRKKLNLNTDIKQFRFSSDKPIKKGIISSYNKKIGFITSSGKSFNLNKFIAIGYLKTIAYNTNKHIELNDNYNIDIDTNNKKQKLSIHTDNFIKPSYYRK
jgi:aminomethyltransferase